MNNSRPATKAFEQLQAVVRAVDGQTNADQPPRMKNRLALIALRQGRSRNAQRNAQRRALFVHAALAHFVRLFSRPVSDRRSTRAIGYRSPASPSMRAPPARWTRRRNHISEPERLQPAADNPGGERIRPYRFLLAARSAPIASVPAQPGVGTTFTAYFEVIDCVTPFASM